MVHELNHLHKAPDRVFNDKDVDSVVERHNARYKKIVMAMSEAKIEDKGVNFDHGGGSYERVE